MDHTDLASGMFLLHILCKGQYKIASVQKVLQNNKNLDDLAVKLEIDEINEINRLIDAVKEHVVIKLIEFVGMKLVSDEKSLKFDQRRMDDQCGRGMTTNFISVFDLRNYLEGNNMVGVGLFVLRNSSKDILKEVDIRLNLLQRL